MQAARPRRRRLTLYAAAALALFAAGVAVNFYARAQQETPRGRFVDGCVKGCIETGAPKASCREVCACLVADLETGRTDGELDEFLERLDRSAGQDSEEFEELKASQERCVSDVGSGG